VGKKHRDAEMAGQKQAIAKMVAGQQNEKRHQKKEIKRKKLCMRAETS
jgi:hypothetical protein